MNCTGHSMTPALFLSTPSARRATLAGPQAGQGRRISIHALREEGDPHRPELALTIGDFYPRPPRGGRLDRLPVDQAEPQRFLSTPSARRATSGFNTFLRAICISIHALREEGDARLLSSVSWKVEFLSTPSARRAT